MPGSLSLQAALPVLLTRVCVNDAGFEAETGTYHNYDMFASAASPHCFWYLASYKSSPSMAVEPREKKCLGAGALPILFLEFITAIG
jgi:hypothetical protein